MAKNFTLMHTGNAIEGGEKFTVTAQMLVKIMSDLASGVIRREVYVASKKEYKFIGMIADFRIENGCKLTARIKFFNKKINHRRRNLLIMHGDGYFMRIPGNTGKTPKKQLIFLK